jgi:trigger factor
VTFQVTVKEIRQRILPALDNDFAKDVGDYQDLDALEDRIKKDLEGAKEHRLTEELREAAIDQLLQANPVEIPSYLVERRTDELLQDLKLRMASQKQELPPEDEGKARGEYQKVAEREVRTSFLLEEISRQESIAVSSEEVEERLQKMATVYQRPLEELRQNSSLKATVQRALEREKVLDFIVAEAEVKYKR